MTGGSTSFGCRHILRVSRTSSIPAFWYWVTKLQARFLAGDYAAALDASIRAETLLSESRRRNNCVPPRRFGSKASSMAPSRTPPHVTQRQAMRGGSTSTSRPAIFRSSSSGLGIVRRTSRTVPRWSPRSWRGLKGGTATPRNCTSKPSVRRARTASSTTKPLPWNSPRSSTRPVASTGSRRRTCETRGPATDSGAPREKCGNSRRSIRISADEQLRRGSEADAGDAGGTPGPLNGAQGVASGAG